MLLGLDIGTSAVKALLLDLTGRTVAEGSAPCAVDRPRGGWAEADPAQWWTAVAAAVAALPPGARGAVRAVGLSGQMHGTVLCDAAGAPARPAVIWLDGRAAPLLSEYPRDAAAITGNPPSAGMTGPNLLWLSRHEPAALAAARWVLGVKDWVRLRLTGEAATDPSDATGTLLSDHEGAWAPALLAAVGVGPDRLPAVVPSAAAAGRLAAGPAAALRLPADVPVAAGAGDTLAAALGSGLLGEDAAQLAIGTSAQVVVPRSAFPGFSPRLNVYRSAAPEGWPRFCLMAAMLNGGLAVDWARGVLGLTWEDAFARAFPAEPAGPRPGGAIFLPYLTGERSPWMQPSLRGGWMGAGAGDDAGTLMRAALEGVAFGVRAGLEALRAHGAAPARLRLVGGGTVHPAFRQLLADVLGLPLEAVTVSNGAARGAALLGGLAAGLIHARDLPRLAPPAEAEVAPRPAAAIAARYARFLELRARLAPWFEEPAAATAAEGGSLA
jgi:xylulokinase